MSAPRCVAPVADLETERLCGADATTTRIVEGVAMPLCEEHAAELDLDRAAEKSARG